MNNNRRVFLAVILSMIVLFAWQYFVGIPKMKAEQAKQAATQSQTVRDGGALKVDSNKPASAPAKVESAQKVVARKTALKDSGPRVKIETPTVDGSIRLTGARFDDLRLRKYHETVDPKSPEIDLLSPTGSKFPYFAELGWSEAGSGVKVPDDKTPWKLVSGHVLTPEHPVVLQWDNGQGLIFTRKVSIDKEYMFSVQDSVKNVSAKAVNLAPYALVVRDGVPEHQHYWVLHEGFVGVAHDKLKDATYKDFKDDDAKPETFSSTGGWLGITDKYWMTALIPQQNETYHGTYRASDYGSARSYQANYLLKERHIAPGQSVSVTHRMFSGAKVVDILRGYQHNQGIARFDLAVDWGWFIFITQPMFWLLDMLNRLLGNFGLAIIVGTILIRAILFPLAQKSFRSMIRMKKIQPQMEQIKKAAKGDQQKVQQEMMALYKKEKVNPLSGCLPMVIQIPILFSLYKVMFVTIEMFHAPFYGWIKDLSAADPTSFINLFGLLPFTVPHTLFGLEFTHIFLSVGILPILMGVTQWIQTKMNPAPADPTQAKVFALMPWIFMFMMAAFPAGLVLYWTWNNLLSVTQQYVMMRKEGVEIHLFSNLKNTFVGRLFTRKSEEA